MNLSAYWKPSLLLLAFATVGTVSWTAAMSVDKAAIAEWHGDTFDLPEGAVLLASSKEYPHQAFRFGSCAYGLQFHVEPDSETWSGWRKQLPSQLAGDDDPRRSRIEQVGRGVIARFFDAAPSQGSSLHRVESGQ
jgi:GMP synthase-like glutamine amidotransferase